MHEEHRQSTLPHGLPVAVAADLDAIRYAKQPGFRRGKMRLARQEMADQGLQVAATDESAWHEVRLARTGMHL